MLLHELLTFAATRTPGAPALVAGDVRRTFAELEDRVARLAGVLAGNATPGDRVAVVADNCAAWVECYYGVPRAGMVLTPINQRLTPTEQADLLAQAEPTVLIGERARLDALAPMAERFPSVQIVAALDEDGWDAMLAAATPLDGLPEQRPDDPAWLLFTSGTTGRPKGAVLTHTSLVAAVVGTAFGRPVQDDDVFATAFPMCHVAGFNVMVFHLRGRPAVVLGRFRADEFAATVATHAVTATSLAPTMLVALLDHLDATGTDLPTLRLIGYGAAPIPPAVLRRAVDRLGVTFSGSYGMTELSGGAVFEGVPNPLVSIRIVDDAMADVGPGEVGEVVVRGDQVTVGYWRDPVATAEAFAGGWFHTGDLGRWDDGRLVVVDRSKDVIITGGENVMSLEVEGVLHDHPAVTSVAVVGIPDAYWGEAICAIVVADGVSADELVAHVGQRLAGFKKPKHVVFVDALPVNAAGKVLKAELRRLAAEHLAR
ncbi:MAG: acyl-CoA synthetase (AMP-forming)/AMP-acid ligase [Actinomycetia bacterium]|nr:acyl-CoA synthetase (AMP-forming)/AMP-acid ligase [Actinomycetes bacterium]